MVESQGERASNPQVLVREIKGEVRGVSITGAHLVSRALDAYPEHIGDGYVSFEVPSGSLIALFDVSLAPHDLLYINSGWLGINESRILNDIISNTQKYIDGMASSQRDLPASLLNFLCQNLAPYLEPSIGIRRRIERGFSAATAFFNPQSKEIEVASVGKNFIGREIEPNTRIFSAILRPEDKFFAPRPFRRIRRTLFGMRRRGGNLKVQTGKVEQGRLLMATDGIVREKNFLQGVRVDLGQTAQNLLRQGDEEGLYLILATRK